MLTAVGRADNLSLMSPVLGRYYIARDHLENPVISLANKAERAVGWAVIALILATVIGAVTVGVMNRPRDPSGPVAAFRVPGVAQWPTMPVPSFSNPTVIQDLRPKGAACAAWLQHAIDTGVVKAERDEAGSVTVVVSEIDWRKIPRDEKIKVAMTVYCARMPMNGELMVTIEGASQGHLLGRVVNGTLIGM